MYQPLPSVEINLFVVTNITVLIYVDVVDNAKATESLIDFLYSQKHPRDPEAGTYVHH